ncbi:MAG TPA: hypothetical protein PLW68_04500 [Casimicrobiaceae bacterium]|nr:hypothetical protein [Casimicrobiaceae bacterium]
MRLTLAVPELLALDRDALAATRSLSALARYSGAPTVRRGSLDDFLVAPHGSATAALAALGAGHDPAASYVLRADPVSLVAGRNDVALGARIGDLDVGESEAMMATLNAHFGGDGLVFRSPRPDAWFVQMDVAPDLATTPSSAVRGAIHSHLPTGPDAPKWRRWLSEMQMLLHGHPANAARAARGRVPVNGVWISGGGRLTDTPDMPGARMFAGIGSIGDVARGLARRQRSAAPEPPPHFPALQGRTDAVVVLPRVDRGAFGELDRLWLAPAVVALERGALDELALLADGDGVASAWRAARPAWSRRAIAAIAKHPFASPVPDEDDA